MVCLSLSDSFCQSAGQTTSGAERKQVVLWGPNVFGSSSHWHIRGVSGSAMFGFVAPAATGLIEIADAAKELWASSDGKMSFDCMFGLVIGGVELIVYATTALQVNSHFVLLPISQKILFQN